MNARLFKRVILRPSHYMPQLHARCFSTTVRPPVLLLAETHTRPAAIHTLYHGLHDLKLRGYNMLMKEGMKAGNTLEEEVLREKVKKNLLEQIFERNPELIELMNRRYKLNHQEFSEACSQLLTEAPSFRLSSHNTIINFLSYYNELNISLYNCLINTGFSYQNLDRNYSARIFRPLASRRDLDFRDEQYVSKISQAYNQGKNVITILGGLHVLSDPESQTKLSSYLSSRMFGRRQLIGDRLRAIGIPCIGLFPFYSGHTPASHECEIWEKQGCFSSQAIDPSNIYSVDIAGPGGIERFLHIFDSMLSANKSQTTEREILPDIVRYGKGANM